MRKSILALVLLAIVVFAVGCGETYTIQNVQFVESVHSKDDDGQQYIDQLIFKEQNGTTHILIANNESLISLLEKGKNYDVSAYRGDTWHRSEAVVEITKPKESK